MSVRLRALVILLIIVVALMPMYYISRVLKRAIKPREAPARLFLFIFANFLLVVVYTMTVVAVIVRLFPPK
ncbi:MAG TPA: hypothetical protein VGM31_23365 [Puia sp.]|jgi:hypothetical protein